LYFAAICLQCIHLTIFVLPQLGQLNLVVPFEFAIFFLQDEHSNFSFGMVFGIVVIFIKVIICKIVFFINYCLL
tara:strand:+ start:1324 stop:1545 length:222 start_codon:yes stop_codon:yes gene_type:complete